MICIACNSQNTHPVYSPMGSKRKAEVFECHSCGTLQSRTLPVEVIEKSLSSDANWGNVRHAKPLRLKANHGRLSSVLLKLQPGSRILDIGASRGHFYELINEIVRDFSYEGIENDLNLPKFSIRRGEIYYSKYESCISNLKYSTYEFILLNHTLEHVDHPKDLLETCRRLMNEVSLLWIDVPDTSIIYDSTVVEEFFIDKHTVHFTKTTLTNLLNSVGFKIVQDYSDSHNLVFLCQVNDSTPSSGNDMQICLKSSLEEYGCRISENRRRLSSSMQKLNRNQNGLLFFGAGRLLDSLINHGGLVLTTAQVCDSYLYQYASGLQYEIVSPDQVDWLKVERVYILARSSKEAIRDYVLGKCEAKIHFFEDLLRI